MVPLKQSHRLSESVNKKKSVCNQIEDDEAFVVTYRNSPKTSRASTRVSYSSFLNGGSPKSKASIQSIYNFIKNFKGKSYGSEEAEFLIIKEIVNAKIELDEVNPNNDLNFNRKYSEMMVSQKINSKNTTNLSSLFIIVI